MTRSFRISSRDVRSLMLTIAAVAVGSGFAGSGANAATSGPASRPFLAHQALYELSLVKSRGSNSINSARGRILYNFTGSACEGYTSEFRQVSELDSGEGKVTLSDLNPPNSYKISGEGEGGVAGFAKGGATVALADKDGGTLLTYNVEAQIGGKLAQLGQRLINGSAKKLADEFFTNFAKAVQG